MKKIFVLVLFFCTFQFASRADEILDVDKSILSENVTIVAFKDKGVGSEYYWHIKVKDLYSFEKDKDVMGVDAILKDKNNLLICSVSIENYVMKLKNNTISSSYDIVISDSLLKNSSIILKTKDKASDYTINITVSTSTLAKNGAIKGQRAP